jgi:hypothetical protein
MAGCPGHKGGGGGTPPGSPATYAEKVSAFTKGVVALETADPYHDAFVTRFTEMAPEEPAGWANLALMKLRASPPRYDEASQYLTRAAGMAPNNAVIENLQGLLASRKGDDPASAILHYKKAVELNPDDLRARYALVKELARQGTGGNAEAEAQVAAIVQRQPDNLFAQLELIRTAAANQDTATYKRAVAMVKARSQTFAPDAIAQLNHVTAMSAGAAERPSMMLENLLKGNAAYHANYIALVGFPDVIGDPLEQFIKLPPIPADPAVPDTALTFAAQPISGAGTGKAAWVGGTCLSDAPPTLNSKVPTNMAPALASTALFADGHVVRLADGKALAFPGGPSATPPGPNGVLPLDANYDMRTDFALAGRGGFKLYLQDKEGGFTDVTAKTGLPASVLNAAYYGAWQADIEADGDIDIILAPVSGTPLVLRNNGDGTWKAIDPFPGVSNVRQFAWADLDGDGNPDAVFLDAQGQLHIYMNQRAGLFRARPVPAGIGKVVAITVGAITSDGQISLLALKADGKIIRIADKDHGTDWTVGDLVQWTLSSTVAQTPEKNKSAQAADPPSPPSGLSVETARLFVADLDNNGGMDIVASTPQASQVWLCDEKYGYQPLAVAGVGYVTAVWDMNGDGLLDLVGLDAQGQPTQWLCKGAKGYHWQEIRPRPADADIMRVRDATSANSGTGGGDKRINAFAIGGEMEMRAGMLYEKQPILGPVLHFGLGTYPSLDVLRIVWPNGDLRAEFADDATPASQRIPPDQRVTAIHRLKGSCPFLFAWNGKEMEFVTDCIWRSPLGLKINAQDTAGVAQTEDWIKIRGDQLVPHDGLYDLRVTAELWETHFFDHLSLLTVDHPVGTDIWVDERFAIPPPPHQVYITSALQPIAHATDDLGNDVTDILSARDGRYLDTFGRGEYQGVTRDHWVEVTLPAAVPASGPLWLICNGWIHPTDSSINVALGQSHLPPPQSLSIETPDAEGRWTVARKGLGFPEGKVKTILLRLDGLFKPGAPRKLRLRTNLEIYWDAIQWAAGQPQTPATIQHLAAKTAELRYRGFSVVEAKDASSPELPQSYDRLEFMGQKWRDLIGYYTRYGDIKELLEKVDDRYVIMNAGDEMRLTFAAPPPPPAGMTRDYVLIGDGWVKDGDYNTTYSKTVLPLPAHDIVNYNTPPGRLQDDPVYRRHPHDWEIYHTRYVTPDRFARGLRPDLPPRPAAAPKTFVSLNGKNR